MHRVRMSACGFYSSLCPSPPRHRHRNTLRQWRRNQAFRTATLEAIAILRTHAATLLIAGTTVTAGGILAIVALHMAAD